MDYEMSNKAPCQFLVKFFTLSMKIKVFSHAFEPFMEHKNMRVSLNVHLVPPPGARGTNFPRVSSLLGFLASFTFMFLIITFSLSSRCHFLLIFSSFYIKVCHSGQIDLVRVFSYIWWIFKEKCFSLDWSLWF